mgnify:CR=1 FL=1
MITGDTVFNGGVGNCKNGGDPHDLYQTIKSFFIPLEDSVVIYPSHDYFLTNLKFAKSIDPSNQNIDNYIFKTEAERKLNKFSLTNIGQEKLYNPFFRAFDESFRKMFNLSEEELFLNIRSQRDHW